LTVIEQPSATGIYLTGRTHLFALNYTVALAVNLVLLRVLVPRYGLMGVGWSWLAGSAVVPVLNLFFGQKLYPLVFHAKLIVLPLLPWIFVFLRWPTEARALISAHFLVQCALSAAVLVGLGGLLFYDIRNGHRQFQNRGAVAPAWEMPSR
jgi:O-antigen/teichoic acid export membrane protein